MSVLKSMAFSYPVKYKNLLVEAGLIGNGVAQIRGYIGTEKKKTLDESSQTWIELNAPKFDYSDVGMYLCPVIGTNGMILGDWTIGLTKDQVKIINEECHVPIYNEMASIYVVHGDTLELSNPVDMAKYRILKNCREIAKDSQSLMPGVNHYWYSPEIEMNKREEELNIKREIFSLEHSLPLHVKRSYLEYIRHKFDGEYEHDFSNEMVNNIFADLAFSDKYRQIYESQKVKDLNLYLMAYRAQVDSKIYIEGEGKITRPDGNIIALSLDDFVDMLRSDREVYNQFSMYATVGTSKSLPESFQKGKPSFEEKISRTYDITINELSDVDFWGKGALSHYLENHGISFQPLTSLENLRELVKSHYRKQGNGNSLTKEIDPEPEILENPKEDDPVGAVDLSDEEIKSMSMFDVKEFVENNIVAPDGYRLEIPNVITSYQKLIRDFRDGKELPYLVKIE